MNQPTALVTGASQGVGHEIVSTLLADNYHVTGVYNSTQPEFEHPNLTWVKADLNSSESIDALCADFLADHDQLDALIHCAGIATLGRIADTPREQWENHMAINFHAPVQATTALLPALRAANGHVVYINSGAGQHANANWGAYSASKHAARAWCDILRQEEPDIRVTSIYPGRIDTAMQRSIIEQEGKKYDASQFLTPSDVAKATQQCLRHATHVSTPDISIRPRG